MNKGSVLTEGQTLKTDDYMVSPSGDCYLTLQADGNLVLYAGSGPNNRTGYLWSALSTARPLGAYEAIMQDDGNLCVYSKIQGNEGYIWGPQTVAPGKKFFASVENGGNLTVTRGTPQQPGALLWAARNRLRLLTYNLHLMEDSNIVVGAWYENKKPVVFYDEERQQYITNKIRECGADIVAIQEVWAEKRMNRMRDDLKGTYPYSYLGSTGNPLIAIFVGMALTKVPVGAAGSGILLLSKYPLKDGTFQGFGYTSDDEDLAASKGVICATVDVPDLGQFRVGMTHAWTDAGGDQCTNIQKLIAVTGTGVGAAAMMGDFNIHRHHSSTKYDTMNKKMNDAGAKDSWRLIHGDDAWQGSITDDETNNTLAQFFSPMRNTANPDCIDYVYLRSSNSLEVRALDARVIKDWKVDTTGKATKFYWVHPGTVAGLPSATTFGPDKKKLCVVVRTTDNKLKSAVYDYATRRWNHYDVGHGTKPPQGAPSVVWFFDTLHLFYQHGGQVMKLESTDGENWSAPNAQGFTSNGGVCAVVYQEKLYVFVRGKDGAGTQVGFHIWQHGVGWAAHDWAGIDTQNDISAAVLGNRMCVVTRDYSTSNTGGVMHMVWENGKRVFGRHVQIAPSAVTTGAPGVMAFKNKFEVFYREKDGGGIFHRDWTPGVGGWSAEDFTRLATTDEVCPASVGDRAFFFYSMVVNEENKSGVKKILFPEDSVMYPPRALAHGRWPVDVGLDASDHFPYLVDIVLTKKG